MVSDVLFFIFQRLTRSVTSRRVSNSPKVKGNCSTRKDRSSEHRRDTKVPQKWGAHKGDCWDQQSLGTLAYKGHCILAKAKS